MDSKARAVAVLTVMARCAGAHEFELAVEHSSVLAVITAVAIVAITMVLLLTTRDGLRLWPRSDDHRQAFARPRTSDMAVQTSADWCVHATPKAAIVWYMGPLVHDDQRRVLPTLTRNAATYGRLQSSAATDARAWTA